jgi:hypothetical protein
MNQSLFEEVHWPPHGAYMQPWLAPWRWPGFPWRWPSLLSAPMTILRTDGFPFVWIRPTRASCCLRIRPPPLPIWRLMQPVAGDPPSAPNRWPSRTPVASPLTRSDPLAPPAPSGAGSGNHRQQREMRQPPAADRNRIGVDVIHRGNINLI